MLPTPSKSTKLISPTEVEAYEFSRILVAVGVKLENGASTLHKARMTRLKASKASNGNGGGSLLWQPHPFVPSFVRILSGGKLSPRREGISHKGEERAGEDCLSSSLNCGAASSSRVFGQKS